jgi:hypothetical protein
MQGLGKVRACLVGDGRVSEGDAELFAAGVHPAEVARQLDVSRQVASTWHAADTAGGTSALASRGPSGLHSTALGGEALGHRFRSSGQREELEASSLDQDFAEPGRS